MCHSISNVHVAVAGWNVSITDNSSLRFPLFRRDGHYGVANHHGFHCVISFQVRVLVPPLPENVLVVTLDAGIGAHVVVEEERPEHF